MSGGRDGLGPKCPVTSFSAEEFYSSGKSRARTAYACSRCGRGLFGRFFCPISFLLSPPLSGRRLDKELNTASESKDR